MKSNKFAFTTFQLDEKVSKLSPEEFRTKLIEKCFIPLEKDTVLDSYLGFVDANNVADTEKFNSLLQGSYYYFGIRKDVFVITKEQMELGVIKYCKDQELDWPTLESATKNEVKELVKKNIKQNIIPVPKFFSAVVDFSNNSIYVFSKNKQQLSDFEYLFNSTFDCHTSIVNFNKPEMKDLYNKIKDGYDQESSSVVLDNEVIFARGKENKYHIIAESIESDKVVTNLIKEASITKLKIRVFSGEKEFVVTVSRDRLFPESITIPQVDKKSENMISDKLDEISFINKYYIDFSNTIFKIFN